MLVCDTPGALAQEVRGIPPILWVIVQHRGGGRAEGLERFSALGVRLNKAIPLAPKIVDGDCSPILSNIGNEQRAPILVEQEPIGIFGRVLIQQLAGTFPERIRYLRDRADMSRLAPLASYPAATVFGGVQV